jgi:hypothetical protein
VPEPPRPSCGPGHAGSRGGEDPRPRRPPAREWTQFSIPRQPPPRLAHDPARGRPGQRATGAWWLPPKPASAAGIIPAREHPPDGRERLGGLYGVVAQRSGPRRWSWSRPPSDDRLDSFVDLLEHRQRHDRHPSAMACATRSVHFMSSCGIRDQHPLERTLAERRPVAAARTWAAHHGWPARWDSMMTASMTYLPAAYPLPPSHRRPERLKPAI